MLVPHNQHKPQLLPAKIAILGSQNANVYWSNHHLRRWNPHFVNKCIKYIQVLSGWWF